MAGRKTVCTEKVVRRLEQYLRGGAFDLVAAEAAGVSRRSFYRWMALGEEGKEPYVTMQERVRRAKALSRVGAEMHVREKDPLSWLKMGPGRERRGEPGWTQPVPAGAEVEPPGEWEEEDPKAMAELTRALEAVERDEEDE